jgi:hypothetical protein
MEVNVQVLVPAALPSTQIHGTHWLRRRASPRAGLHAVVKIKFLPIPGIEPRSTRDSVIVSVPVNLTLGQVHELSVTDSLALHSVAWSPVD